MRKFNHSLTFIEKPWVFNLVGIWPSLVQYHYSKRGVAAVNWGSGSDEFRQRGRRPSWCYHVTFSAVRRWHASLVWLYNCFICTVLHGWIWVLIHSSSVYSAKIIVEWFLCFLETVSISEAGLSLHGQQSVQWVQTCPWFQCTMINVHSAGNPSSCNFATTWQTSSTILWNTSGFKSTRRHISDSAQLRRLIRLSITCWKRADY